MVEAFVLLADRGERKKLKMLKKIREGKEIKTDKACSRGDRWQ